MKKIAKIEISYFVYDDCFENSEQEKLFDEADHDSKLIFITEKADEKLYLEDNIKKITIL